MIENEWYKIVVTLEDEAQVDDVICRGLRPVVAAHGRQLSEHFFTRSYDGSRNTVEFYIRADADEAHFKQMYAHLDSCLKGQVLYAGVSQFKETEHFFGRVGDLYLARYYCQTNDLAFRVLEKANGEYPKKLDAALDMMIISADCAYDTIQRGYLSYCSHVNGFFTRWKDPQKIEKTFFEKYKKLSPYLHAKVTRLLENGGGDEAYIQYRHVLLPFKETLTEAFSQGQLTVTNIENGDETSQGYRDFLERSPFHREIVNNDAFLHHMNHDPAFLSGRLLTIFTYLLLRRVGIKHKDRYALCYYIYRTVEELFDLNSLDLIKSFAEKG